SPLIWNAAPQGPPSSAPSTRNSAISKRLPERRTNRAAGIPVALIPTRVEQTMPKLSTCLWFDGKAEDAVNFYASVFNDAKIVDTLRYGDAGPGPKGSVLTV